MESQDVFALWVSTAFGVVSLCAHKQYRKIVKFNRMLRENPGGIVSFNYREYKMIVHPGKYEILCDEVSIKKGTKMENAFLFTDDIDNYNGLRYSMAFGAILFAYLLANNMYAKWKPYKE